MFSCFGNYDPGVIDKKLVKNLNEVRKANELKKPNSDDFMPILFYRFRKV